MDFVVEDLSPVRKKVIVSANAAEVDSALNDALRHVGRDFSMPGFRKGKVPSGVLERRFGDEVKSRVAEDFLGVKLEIFLQEKDIVILSRPEYEGGAIARGQDFSCALTFEAMPAFDMPAYTGLKVEEIEAAVSDGEVDDVLERLRGNMAQETPVEEARRPVAGDAVDVDFAGFENNEPLADVKGEHFHVVLGEGQVLPDFEAIIRDLVPGEEREGPVAFPDNYAHSGLAGKTVVMRVKLNSLSTRILPAADDAFAKTMGQESLGKMREAIAESMRGRLRQQAKAQTQQKLMDAVLAQVDFPLPEGMVKLREERILGDARLRLEQQEARVNKDRPVDADAAAGAKIALEATLATMQPEARREAEILVRMHLVLMSVARKENIQASPLEADMQLRSMAMRSGQNFDQLREAYVRSGMMGELLERIRADKAMDFIYDRAEVVTVPALAAPECVSPAGD
ncbi:MAG: trigger factor [Deltaproteobacteria bacterium]|jgi:trigger factor|nr:trigger factor [Deltaproteobacteria bacterium]